MKVLVIDDNQEDRNIIISHIKKFEKKEIKVEECNCLKNGLEQLSKYNYDAVILDLSLPETDGIITVEKTLEHLKNNNKTIPVIVLTGMEDYSIGRKAWGLGVKDFLIKDEVQTKDLLRALTFATLNK